MKIIKLPWEDTELYHVIPVLQKPKLDINYWAEICPK